MGFSGPEILTRTMTVATKKGASKTAWQYHSRSDTHSKVACWTLLFDLLDNCDVARGHAAAGRLGFGINHVMVGPINKTLDLVVTLVDRARDNKKRVAFADLVERYGIVMTKAESQRLASLPVIYADSKKDVCEVALAIEAKACMTEHTKSLPRLHAEILATGYLARQAAPQCITASYNLVNAAPRFISPGNKGKVNKHSQPDDARTVLNMLGKAIPLARNAKDLGYDVIGATAIHCVNDGSSVSVASGAASPESSEHIHYERMMVSLCSEFRRRFPA